MINNKADCIATVIIAAIVTLIISMLFTFETQSYNNSLQYNTPYENFPDAYEDSSFNPYHGYIPHTQINKR